MFYNGLKAGNFKRMSEQAGLCNICTEYGAQNFQNIVQFTDKLAQTSIDLRKSEELQKRLATLKGYLLSEFSSNLNVHDECPFHCMTLLLSEKPSCSTQRNTIYHVMYVWNN